MGGLVCQRTTEELRALEMSEKPRISYSKGIGLGAVAPVYILPL